MKFGIDGGGTNTRIRIVDANNRELSYLQGASSNIYSVGAEQALQNIKQLILNACASQNLPLVSLTKGCIGSAGLQRPYERKLFENMLSELLPQAQVRLCTDAEIMLVGGLDALEGYSLTCGTGSIALGRKKDGTLVRAGGLGYMLGDEGSALWIAYEAIKRSMRSREGRDLETNMLNALLQHFSLDKSSEFIQFLHQNFDKARIASACPLVFAAMEQKDTLACDIIQKAIQELLALVQSVQKQLPLNNAKLVLGGGIFENNKHFRNLFQETLSSHPELPPGILPIHSAVHGALLLAEELH